jgi:hypothetical protein
LFFFDGRKRTKKSAPRPGRPKKARAQIGEGTSGCSSPRTRAAAAKEAADIANKMAQLAADKAQVAVEAAAAAEMAAAKEIAAAKEAAAAQVAALEAPGSPQTPPRYISMSSWFEVAKKLHSKWFCAHRNTCMELQVVNQMEDGAGASTKKMTPRRKVLATKIKKKSPAKKNAAKKK